MKKKTRTPEQTLEKPTRTPDSMTTTEFARAMFELRRSEGYRVLKAHWLIIQAEIIEQGKKKPSELQWAVLDGFHRAVQEVEIWAGKHNTQEKKQRPMSPVEGME